MPKRRSFWFHYNKPASKKAGKPQLTLHHGGTCHLVDNIVVGVPTHGHLRKTQPFFVMGGQASVVEITNGVAFVS